MRDMRKWMNVKFISAMDLLKDDGSGYKTLEVTILKIEEPTPVQCGPKKEKLAVASFKGGKKRMILRNSHMKGLIKIFGPDVDKMEGQKVRLWIETGVKAFGEVMDCVRFKPINGDNRSLMPSFQPPSSQDVNDLDETTPAEEKALVDAIAGGDEPPEMSPSEREAFQKAQGEIAT